MKEATINLGELDNQPPEIREAVAFYTAFSILPTNCTVAERAKHYTVLEEAGLIEKVGALNGTN
ncbi:hypothetical protein SD71_16075 [Cohnella kolymensis]|uniref:Uncharacterized protein n=1 Tax=Cohnella kolymensis TaxID=1590652 RepID=A0ABR5A285_9BACL|nr:hypothetical protein [Cohnella kolymensis]KIL35145.1 hypothetical protein SD71_16075 [Cohnella kolymensis]